MTADQVKLGIVGFGRIVELIHLPLLKQVQQIEVRGIYDVTPQRLELAAKRGFSTYSQLEELLSSELDAVLIATPPNSHFPIAVEVLKSGKHALIEKPVTLSADEAIQLKQIADQFGKVVSVFHNRRFDPDYLLVKRIISEGILGSILFVDRRHHMFGSGASFGVKSFHPGWRNETCFGGGALMDWGVHLIDQLLRLEFGRCDKINARMNNLRWQQGEVDDHVYASIVTDHDILLSMEVNFGSNATSPLWVVGGDQATLQVVSETEAVVYEKGKPARQLMLDSSPKERPVRIYSTFADCLLRGGKLAVTLEEAIETMQVLDSIRTSAQRNTEAAYGNSVHSTAGRI